MQSAFLKGADVECPYATELGFVVVVDVKMGQCRR